MFDYMAALFDTGHDGVVGGDAVAIVLEFSYFYKDGVSVTVLGKHYVLVSTTRSDGKSANAVVVEISDGLNSDVDFFGGGVWEWAGYVI